MADETPSRFSKAALATYLAGAGADIGSTAYFQSHPELKIHEANPLINWAPTGTQLPIGASLEMLAMCLGRKLLKNHPKIMNAITLGAGAVHGGLALKNLRLIRRQQALNQMSKD